MNFIARVMTKKYVNEQCSLHEVLIRLFVKYVDFRLPAPGRGSQPPVPMREGRGVKMATLFYLKKVEIE